MNHAVKTSRVLTGGLLLALAFNSAAISLGRAKGMVWIGRPLDVTIPVTLDPGMTDSGLCATAEVFHSDTRVGGQKVKVSVEPGSSPSEAFVRVRSSALVDEPVVTIYLKTGCGDTSTRRYVLLSEVPAEYAAPPVVGGVNGRATVGTAPLVAPPAPSDTSPRRSGSQSQSGGDSLVQAAVDATRQKADAAKAVARSAPKATPAPAPAPKARSVVRKSENKKPLASSRLKLDPVELLAERDPVLRASTEILSLPADGEARRAQAAALWRAINASPEEIIRDEQRLQALQADVAALRAQSQKSQSALAELKSRVEKAQSERYANNLVYGLLAGLLVAIGAAAYFWNRSRQQTPAQWWGEQTDEIDSAGPAPVATPVPAVEDDAGTSVSAGLDIDLDEMPEPVDKPSARVKPAAMVRTAVLPAYDGSDFQSSLTGAGRAVKVEELFDLQQQADFFISLGQYDQAAATLRNHISDSNETSAVAYLDLLKVYHLQGRKHDYDQVRKEFNEVFNAEVPEFEAFGLRSRGLESYESAISRIVALWPSSKVLDVIEESIFRKPGQGNQTFDLEAYRELLLLYAIAREVVQAKDRGPVLKGGARSPDAFAPFEFTDDTTDDSDRPKFQSTDIQPLPVARAYLGDTVNSDMRVPPSPNLGLDIDLSLLDAAAVEPLPSALAPAPAPSSPSAAPAKDSHIMDFDLFDLAQKVHEETKRSKR